MNKLPDLIYVSVTFKNNFAELYGVRKRLRRAVAWRRMFMEDVARDIAFLFPEAVEVTVTLGLSRHVVKLTPVPLTGNPHAAAMG